MFYKLRNYIKTEYWYRFRKRKYLEHFDGKYIERKHLAGEVLSSWYNGENDILEIMLLKIEQMFFELKKNGFHSYFYVDSFNFFEEGATESDRLIFFHRIIDDCERNPNKYKDYFFFNRTEYYSDKKFESTVTKEDKKHKNYCGFENRWWIGNEETDDKEVSTSGLVHYYFYHCRQYDGEQFQEHWGISKTFDRKNKETKAEIVFVIPPFYSPKDIQKVLDDKGIKIDFYKGLLLGAQSMDVSDMKVFAKMSPYIKSVARGLRRTLKELLILRHKIKKLNELSDTDDKYYSMWKDAEEGEKMRMAIKSAYETYEADRKKLYEEIFTLMANRGNTWWD